MNSKNTVTLPHDKRGRYGQVVHKNLDPLPLVTSSQDDMDKIALKLLELDRVKSDGIKIRVRPDNEFSKAHFSYPYYLLDCFANHYGVEISADLLWFTAMGTFTKHVASNAELLRTKFVDFQGKRTVKFLPESNNMDDWLAQYLQGVYPLLRVDKGVLFPKFTTSTPKSRLAMEVSVCDLVSPYITGMILGCGIPKITVRGTEQDYIDLRTAAEGMATHFKDDTKATEFFIRIAARAQQLADFLQAKDDGNFLHKFFDCANCSSGSAVYEISGWITEFVAISSRRGGVLLKDEAMSCAMAKFEVDYAPNTRLACLAGVFNSKYDAETNILRPQFDRFWVEYTVEK